MTQSVPCDDGLRIAMCRLHVTLQRLSGVPDTGQWCGFDSAMRRLSRKHYRVSWYGDEVSGSPYATFEEACARVSEGLAKGIDVRGYQIVNGNCQGSHDDGEGGCVGDDGLTDEEREALEEIL